MAKKAKKSKGRAKARKTAVRKAPARKAGGRKRAGKAKAPKAAAAASSADKVRNDLAAAKAKVRDAQKEVTRLSRELAKLTGAKGGRKSRTPAGRKAYIKKGVKKEVVADFFKKAPSGINYGKVKKTLMVVKDKATGAGVFSAADFNSAKVFAKKLLPSGWKLEGVRQKARLVKK